MIAFIRGRLITKTADSAIIEAAGLGYLVQTPHGLLEGCQPMMEVQLHTTLLVSQESHTLYGFNDARDRQLFELLLKVSGIGPRSALALISAFPFEQFLECIREERKEWLLKVPGIGKKSAERLLFELKDKLPKEWLQLSGANSGAQQDAIAALMHLGYHYNEASRAVQTVNKESLSLSETITAALQCLRS